MWYKKKIIFVLQNNFCGPKNEILCSYKRITLNLLKNQTCEIFRFKGTKLGKHNIFLGQQELNFGITKFNYYDHNKIFYKKAHISTSFCTHPHTSTQITFVSVTLNSPRESWCSRNEGTLCWHWAHAFENHTVKRTFSSVR